MKKFFVLSLCVVGFLWFAKFSYEKVDASDSLKLAHQKSELEEKVENLEKLNESLLERIRNLKDEKKVKKVEKKEEVKEN